MRELTATELKPRCEGTVAKKTLQTYVSKARRGATEGREGIKTKRVGAPRLTGLHFLPFAFHFLPFAVH